jgi:NAD(P)-dependent dehydrogenase (short-subunit alcohol dehydrogenase family)
MKDEEIAMDLRGRGAIVTGGSRGLGAAIGAGLAAAGARVVLVARGAEALEETAARIRAAGGEAHILAEDVGDKDATYRIAGAAAALAGPIDVLVHNASTLGPVPLRLLLDTDCEDVQRTLDVNLVGPFRLTKALVGSMALRGTGVVVHVSSDAATNAYPRWGAYGVSKAALDHLNRVWAAELEGTGVSLLSVDPGEMDTEMHAAAMPDADRSALAKPADVAARIVRLIARARSLPAGARLDAAAAEPGP